MPNNTLQKILVVSKDIDLLSTLYFFPKRNKYLVEVCNNPLELLPRAKRFRPDVLLVDEDTYLDSSDFSHAAKIIKATQAIRVILLVKNRMGITVDESVVDESFFLSKDDISHLFK
jgi:DNA-binding response OmpR family regulator